MIQPHEGVLGFKQQTWNSMEVFYSKSFGRQDVANLATILVPIPFVLFVSRSSLFHFTPYWRWSLVFLGWLVLLRHSSNPSRLSFACCFGCANRISYTNHLNKVRVGKEFHLPSCSNWSSWSKSPVSAASWTSSPSWCSWYEPVVDLVDRADPVEPVDPVDPVEQGAQLIQLILGSTGLGQ